MLEYNSINTVTERFRKDRVAGAGREPDRACPRLISVVVPFYDEEGNVGRLTDRLVDVLSGLPYEYELVYVDDGSQDDTWSEITEVAATDARVTAYRLSRNFGHQNALLAGLQYSSGDIVIAMDSDLQHPPELIPHMLLKCQEGFDIVNTKRLDSRVANPLKRLSSRYFYRIFSELAEVPLMEGSSDFRLLHRRVVDALLEFHDPEIFLRGAVQWLGFESATLPFDAAPRHSGVSKYGLRKMVAFAVGGIVSFSSKPLRIGIWIGLFTAFLAFVELMYILAVFTIGNTVPGWASTLGIVSFLFGVVFLLLGIMGIYLAGIHRMLQARPRFVVSDVLDSQSRKYKESISGTSNIAD